MFYNFVLFDEVEEHDYLHCYENEEPVRPEYPFFGGVLDARLVQSIMFNLV